MSREAYFAFRCFDNSTGNTDSLYSHSRSPLFLPQWSVILKGYLEEPSFPLPKYKKYDFCIVAAVPHALPLRASTVYSLYYLRGIKKYTVAKRLFLCSPWIYSCKLIREQTLKVEPFTNLFVMETPNEQDLVLKDVKSHPERTFSEEANSLLRDKANSSIPRVPSCCPVLHLRLSHNKRESCLIHCLENLPRTVPSHVMRKFTN